MQRHDFPCSPGTFGSAAARRAVASGALLLLVVGALLGSLLVADGRADADQDADFATRVNAARAGAGLPGLRVTADLTRVAQEQSARMAASGQLAHNPSLVTAVSGWLRLSENVGYGPDVATIHAQLMASPDHLANMLDPAVSQVGVGTAWSGDRLYVTEVFRQPDGSTVDAPSLPAPAPSPTRAVPDRLSCPADVASAGFADVPVDSVHAWSIDCVVAWRLAEGLDTGLYGPDHEVTRGQLATFLAGVVDVTRGLPARPRDHFRDDDGTPHEASINALAQLGILHGTGPDTFSPQTPVNRSQMATFLVGLQERLSGVALIAGPTPFTDATGVHATSIAKAYTARLTAGVDETTYGAGALVRRDEMASFLVNELDLLIRGGQLNQGG